MNRVMCDRPAVLKRLRDNKFTMHRNYYRIVIYYRDPLRGHHFPWVLQASLLSKKGSQRSQYREGGG